MDENDKMEGYLRLYERQMTHYEKTQEIEWKGSFGVWTLLAAAIVWASKNWSDVAAIPPGAWRGAVVGIVLAYAVWLRMVHRSQEFDKELWTDYREKIESLLGATTKPREEGWWQRGERRKIASLGRRLLWLTLEVGITAGMAWVLWLIAK